MTRAYVDVWRAHLRIVPGEAEERSSRHGRYAECFMDVPERIEVEEGTRVLITWGDDEITELTARQLRRACPCAGCREPDGRARIEAVLGGPAPVTISDARLVGGYALGFSFAPDGHSTGIFSFDVLKGLSENQLEDQSPEASGGSA